MMEYRLSRAERVRKSIALKQWKQSRNTQIVALAKAGETLDRIAEQVLCSASTVSNVLRKHREGNPTVVYRPVKRGRYHPPGFWTQDRCALIALFWSRSYTCAEIADKIGCTRDAVIGKAHRLKLPARRSPITRAA